MDLYAPGATGEMMELRRLVRGSIDWPRLEAVAREIADRYDLEEVRIEFLEADNWLSTPFVVNDRFFVKVISRQNSMVHALFTSARNLGAFSRGTEGFFEHFDGPVEMAAHELEATKRIREIGLNAPEPIESFEVDGLGVLVMEYLPAFRTLNDLTVTEVEQFAPDVFEALATMHRHALAHGDLRGENVLVYENEVYFIDATNVREDGIDGAKAYDLACALAALSALATPRVAVAAAAEYYSPEDLLAAREFVDFVNMRPDHDFDATAVKGEIEKRAETEVESG